MDIIRILHFSEKVNNLSLYVDKSTNCTLDLKKEKWYNKSKAKKGDMIVTVQIKLPEILSEKEKALYNQLKELSKYNIRKDLNNAK